MYSDHFGFSQLPFENSLDAKFLYLGESHEEVLAALLYFVRERKSFAMVTGDVGTGKTMLLSSFISMLPGNVRAVTITHPDVGYLEILYYLCAQLGISKKNKTVLQLLDEIKTVLVRELAEGQRTVLIIDEAHLLSNRGLEHIRLLSNIETRTDKLLQILLAGQHELSHRLKREDMRQLRQRININRYLAPLAPEETIRYIDHRLEQVGSSYEACFDARCSKLLVQLSGGVPRLINQLCDNALLICRTEESQRVTPDILRKASEVLQTDVFCLPENGRQGWLQQHRRLVRWVLRIAPALAAAILLGVMWWT